jgi:hypothetical protein
MVYEPQHKEAKICIMIIMTKMRLILHAGFVEQSRGQSASRRHWIKCHERGKCNKYCVSGAHRMKTSVCSQLWSIYLPPRGFVTRGVHVFKQSVHPCACNEDSDLETKRMAHPGASLLKI